MPFDCQETNQISGGKVVGFGVVEINPFLDPVGLTQSAAVRIILEFLGANFTPLIPDARPDIP